MTLNFRSSLSTVSTTSKEVLRQYTLYPKLLLVPSSMLDKTPSMTSLKLTMMSCSVMALSLLLKLRKPLAPCKFPSRGACCTASSPWLLDVEEGCAIAAPMDSFVFGAGSATPPTHGSYVEEAGLWTSCCTPAPLFDSLMELAFEWLAHPADLLLVLGQVVAALLLSLDLLMGLVFE